MQARCCHRSCETRSNASERLVATTSPWGPKPPEIERRFEDFPARHDSSLQTEIHRLQPLGLRKFPRFRTTASGRSDQRTPPKRRPTDTMPLDESPSSREGLLRRLASVVGPKLLDVRHPRWQERLHSGTPAPPSGTQAEQTTGPLARRRPEAGIQCCHRTHTTRLQRTSGCHPCCHGRRPRPAQLDTVGVPLASCRVPAGPKPRPSHGASPETCASAPERKRKCSSASDRVSPFRPTLQPALPTLPPTRPKPDLRFIAAVEPQYRLEPSSSLERTPARVVACGHECPRTPIGTDAADRTSVRMPDALVRCCHRMTARCQQRRARRTPDCSNGPRTMRRTVSR